MTQLWKVLEQAERERALTAAADHRGTSGPGPVTTGVPSPPDAAPAMPRSPVAPAPGPKPAPAPPRGVDDHLVSLLHPASYLAEPYRMIRHQLEQARRTAQVSIVAVSSASVGQGKTTTAINVAGALAQAPGARVLLVDADLRKASVAEYLAIRNPQGTGLVDAILDPDLALDDVVISLPAFNLHVVPAGHLPPAPYEILESPRLGDLLAEARRCYDFVVLDTAPLVPLPDSRLIGQWIDGFIVVVAAHRTRRALLAELLNLLDPAKLLGLVFNEEDPVAPGGYGYRGYGATSGHPSGSGWRTVWHRTVGLRGNANGRTDDA
jgi:capsular exopolysaccharide synthesis family protein